MKDIEIVRVEVKTIEHATIMMLTTPVGEGIRLNNAEITAKLVEKFGKGSINCVRWYASKLRTEPKYAAKYKIDDANLCLTPRAKQKS